MKRYISIILILIMLAAAAGAPAEGNCCGIEAQIQAGDQEIRTNLNICMEEDRIYFTSSLIPETCVQLSGIATEQTMDALEELFRNLTDGKTIDIIRNCAEEWFVFMQPETRTGSFSGDAFEQASSMQHVSFSCGDLMLLAQKIRKALTEQGTGAVLLTSDWSDLMTPERNIRFDLKIFDGGKYASLNVLDGKDVVMTVSANISEPDCILLITGYGYSGKNYYSRILAEKKESRLDVTETLYADDYKTGYPGLGEDSLICTRNSTIEWTTEEVKFSGCLFPANGLTPIAGSGILRTAASGRVFEGEIHFSGYDGIRATITADISSGNAGKMPAKTIDLDKADEKELIALGTEIGVALLPALFQIVSALPEEYAAPVKQLMGY